MGMKLISSDHQNVKLQFGDESWVAIRKWKRKRSVFWARNSDGACSLLQGQGWPSGERTNRW